MYRVGELDQLIDIKREVLADDGMGGQEVTLTNIDTNLPALARPRSAREYERYDKLNAAAMYLFVVRYRDDIREDDRIVWDGVDYNIRSILTRGGRHRFLELDAERGVAQ